MGYGTQGKAGMEVPHEASRDPRDVSLTELVPRGPDPVLLGLGSYLPGEPVTNDQLGTVFGREVVHVAELLGVRTRHVAIDLSTRRLPPGVSNAGLATSAARLALADADVDASEVDLLVMATCTPDHTFPATALFVQEQLGIPPCCVIELRAGCGGMAQAFTIASHMIRAGTSRRALLVGSDLISPFLAMFDEAELRSDDVLVSLAMFGDGAGAAVLGATTGGPRVVKAHAWSLSPGRPAAMMLRAGGALAFGTDDADTRPFVHDGRAVLEHGPDLIRSACRWLRDDAGVDLGAVGHFVPPQVNTGGVATVAAEFGVNADRVYSDFERVGNTVSAAIYLALDRLRSEAVLAGTRVVLLPAEATKWLCGAVVLDWAEDDR